MNKLDVLTGEPLGRKCSVQEETTEDLIFECDCLDRETIEILGFYKVTGNLAIKIFRFLELTDLLGACEALNHFVLIIVDSIILYHC